MKTKALFFDKERVIEAVGRGTAAAMGKAGAHIRTKARSLLRKRKAPAPAGMPPSVHSDDKIRNLRNIQFAYDEQAKSLVVGMVGLGHSQVPGLMELGGEADLAEVKYPGSQQWYQTKKAPRQGQMSRRRGVKYEKRPTMAPALESEAMKLPTFLQSQVGE